jgi:hypothetical protein
VYGTRALAVLIALLLCAPLALAEDEPTREVWRFRKGETTRRVDVTDMPDFVREAVERRLLDRGFERVTEAEAPWGSLEEAARRLVGHGGRFPELRLETATSEQAPASDGAFFGAAVRVESGADGALRWHVLRVEDGSLAAAMGLVPGDRVTRVDGGPASPAALARLGAPGFRPLQLSLVVLRREGRTQKWDLEFQWARAGPSTGPEKK